MSVKKMFSEPSPYRTEDGKDKSVTVYCTVFDDLSYAFHDGGDNPNFLYVGNSMDHLERDSARAYCKQILVGRVIDYIRGERKENNKKQVNQQ